jgi:hypothetical protein
VEFTRNPTLETELFNRLRLKYTHDRPDVPHLTELIYCLTKGYYDRFDRLQPTQKEMLYFAIGFGLEEVILRDATSLEPQLVEVDGVYMSLDYIALDGVGVDLKSTRMYPSKDDGSPSYGWPQGWRRQFMGYAKHLGQTEFDVAILYLGAPDLVAGRLSFTQQEMDDNWDHIMMRKTIYMAHVAGSMVPAPFTFTEDPSMWECKDKKGNPTCKYYMRCEAASRGGS